MDIALASFGDATKLSQMKLLPSQKTCKIPRSYALFRAEVTHNERLSSIAWCTSTTFGFLDPKDSLYYYLRCAGAGHCMPVTQLIPWDGSGDDINIPPNSKMLLKAALGSGGDSLYFVTSAEQVLHVMQSHAAKAQNTPDFNDTLASLYGKVPSWSLQELLTSYLPNMQQKCQIRAYVVTVGQHLYLYKSYEVRFPLWKEEDPNAPKTPYVSADLEFCGDSGAVPYNANRSKASTERYELSEVCSDATISTSITDTMRCAFTALREPIHEKMESDMRQKQADWGIDFEPDPVLLAVGGVDLLLDNNRQPKIVEINNNPAMPQQHKHMSEKYRMHLVNMVRGIVNLGISTSQFEEYGFEQIW